MEDLIQAPEREYASVLTRFGAILLDGLLLVPFYIPLLFASWTNGEPKDVSASYVVVMIVTVVAMLVFAVWNTIVRMGKTGQSLGRKFLNIAVLSGDGEPIGVGSAFLREVIGRWLSGLVCYIGYLNAFWDPDRQMWHDKLAKCYVYYVEDNFS